MKHPMVFRDLGIMEEAEFEEAADKMFNAAVDGTGELKIDLGLWHPVFLERLADDLAEWAKERRSLCTD